MNCEIRAKQPRHRLPVVGEHFTACNSGKVYLRVSADLGRKVLGFETGDNQMYLWSFDDSAICWSNATSEGITILRQVSPAVFEPVE